jgi:hypothetical protein
MLDNCVELRQWTVRAMTTPPKSERGQAEDMAKAQLALPSAESIPPLDDLFLEIVEPDTLSYWLWGEDDFDEQYF